MIYRFMQPECAEKINTDLQSFGLAVAGIMCHKDVIDIDSDGEEFTEEELEIIINYMASLGYVYQQEIIQ